MKAVVKSWNDGAAHTPLQPSNGTGWREKAGCDAPKRGVSKKGTGSLSPSIDSVMMSPP